MHGSVREEVATIRHSVTRFRINMICLNVQYLRGSVPINARWVHAEDLRAYPLSTPQRKLARLIS